jgi:hypothetical protein
MARRKSFVEWRCGMVLWKSPLKTLRSGNGVAIELMAFEILEAQ